MLNHHLTPKLKLLGSEHAIYVILSNRLKEQKLCYMELWDKQKSKPIEWNANLKRKCKAEDFTQWKEIITKLRTFEKW